MSLHLGVIGLATMGSNLARNAASRGITVSVFNRTPLRTKEFIAAHQSEGQFIASESLAEFAASIPAPRRILLMVKAGQPVDALINELKPHLSAGDILIDGGNSHYDDTERREKELSSSGIFFVGMGISGGEEGALKGPSLMPGGSKEAYELLAPILQQIAADDGLGGKCVTHVGTGGAGHFVKMVHNGIEYSLMQILAESYHLLSCEGGLDNTQLAKTYGEWSTSRELGGFLTEITAEIFKKKDEESGQWLLDLILDTAAQKGTGKWTTDAALTFGVSVPSITAAVDARILSSQKERRVQRSTINEPALEEVKITAAELTQSVRAAVDCSALCSYAEGFELIEKAGAEKSWGITLSEVARIWRGGCIIRSTIVEDYQKAYEGDELVAQAMLDRCSGEAQHQWRSTVALGALRGIPLAAISSSLWWFDASRSEQLPQNLVQAQRDYFGAHTYKRVDREGDFHTQWKS